LSWLLPGLREHVAQQLAQAAELYRKHPTWPVLEVTNRAIEETAADILRLLGERGQLPPYLSSRSGA
jgi:regulator of PEP synthase PpsR (kinase-PPPase family)